MCVGAIQETSCSLESYSFGVAAIPAGSRGIFVCFEGALDFGQQVQGGDSLGVVGSKLGNPRGGGGDSLPPPPPRRTSSHSWLDCPTLAACRPPISVGHQGNRATLEPEPGDIQLRLGLGDGGGSLKGWPTRSRIDWGPSPLLRLCTSHQALDKPMWGPATSLFVHCCLIHIAPTLKS